MTRGSYFRRDVVVEPLFNRWYAWPYLIPPASAAMYVAFSHLKIMQSFVAAPQIHASALKNRAMLGGPFINYDASRRDEISALISQTAKESAGLLDLAEAIKTFEEVLFNEADGCSLESYYKRAPEALKGYVELVYDVNNSPSIRFIEGLLYKSRYYNTSSQSVVLSKTSGDGRPFVFSTPRLKDENSVSLDVPFSFEGLDELFKMKVEPKPLDYIKELLSIRPEDSDLFASFFTDEPCEPLSRYQEDGVRVRYFGHACLLVESNEVSILCDPMISYSANHEISRYTYADLPDHIDYVLITHNHQDHMMFETLIQLRHRIRNLIVPRSSGGDRIDPSLKSILQVIGFKNVLELEQMERLEVEGGFVMGLPFLGEHADLNIRTKMAYYINLKGKRLLVAADSNNLESMLYKHIHELIGDTDIVFLGMECDGAPMSWLYGPLLTKPLIRKNDQSRRLDGSNYEKAITIVDLLKPKEVYVYAMGQEPWCTFLTSVHYTSESRPIIDSNRLVEECRSRGLVSERLFGQKEMLYT